MASTNPFPNADSSSSGTARGAVAPGRQRNKGRGKKAANNSKLAKQSSSNNGEKFNGWPSFDELKPVLVFLCFPGLVAISVIAFGGIPKPLLYLSGLIIGIMVALSTLKTAEITIACILLYLPFAKSYVIPILPGLNGTNMIILLGIGTAVLQASREKTKLFNLPPGSGLVIAFALYTAMSGITITFQPGGAGVLKAEILSFKSWLDQFIIYFILAALIRDRAGAKRAMVYVLIGSMLVVLHTIPEILEKMGRSSIEKSRLIGPQLQSNNFGGFVAYTLLPLLAIFLVFIKDIRAWLLTPYFIIAIKVLITTFSRGAYLAMAAGGFLAGYYRGKGFLISMGTLAVCLVLVFPQIIPASISARMGPLMGGQEVEVVQPEEKIDKSGQTRLDMWKGAMRMMAESPILGKGFKSFPLLKDQYVENFHPEDDPHSMYMYLGSQMGLPALALFISLMGSMFFMGRYHSRNKNDEFIRALGIGGTAASVCMAVVCIFGSRFTALNFTIYFWAILLVLQVLKGADQQEDNEVPEQTGKKKGKRNRGVARLQAGSEEAAPALVQELPVAIPQARSRAEKRLPKRGAAAHMARVAEQKKLDEQIRVQKAAQQQSSSKSLQINSDEAPAPYETRAARRAREAAQLATESGRRKKRKRL